VTRGKTGAVLLEVLVAMTILAVAGMALLSGSSQAAQSLSMAREREREMRDASAFLDAVSLWTRADLDRHLGTRPQGPWRMHVARPTVSIYEVTITDSATSAPLLRTSIYRSRSHINEP